MNEGIAGVVALLISLPIVNSARASSVMELPVIGFWAGPGIENDNRVVRIEDHQACSGQRVFARVSEMPAPGANGSLQPELVVELSDAGTIIQQWPIPVDDIVIGIRGDQILVPYDGDSSGKAKVLSISSNLSFSISSRPAALPDSSSIDCPILPEFKESAYLRYFEYLDLESNAVRRLAYQGPCT